MATASSNEGEVGLAIQGSKGNAATTFYMLKHTRFNWTPDVVQDEEGEAEIGGGLDVSPAERYGHQGATFRGEGRARPGHVGFLLRFFGMEDADIRFSFQDGINDVIRVTDTGGGPVDVDILAGTGFTLVANTQYTADEVCAGLKAVLDGDATLTGTHTITFSTTTRKFTIVSDSGTFSLHWNHANSNMADTLGYDDSADDTGALTYIGDYALNPRFFFIDDVLDVIRVTDDGGGPVDVDILDGTGSMLTEYTLYHPGMVAAALQAVLTGDATLTQTYVVDHDWSTYKFTISHAGSTLSLHWSHANDMLAEVLGFATSADDTGATTYTGDNPTSWPIAHVFSVYTSGSSFPWGTILDKFDQDATLDTLLIDCRINTFSFQCDDADVVRFSYEGRCLSFEDAVGTEVENNDVSTISTPNTKKGSLYFGSAGYKIASLGSEFRWAENIVPALVQYGPEEIIPGRRAASGTSDIYMGAEASGGVFRASYYGSASGTAFSTTLVERAMYALFQSGQAVSGLLGSTVDYYGIRLCYPECRMLTYPLEKSGDDPEMATLGFQITKESTTWRVIFLNDYAAGYYD